MPNKLTHAARQIIVSIADDFADEFRRWLDAVAHGDPARNIPPDPEAAAKLYLAVLEYHVPKLARAEVTGRDGGPVQHAIAAIEWRVVQPAARREP